MCHRVRGVNHFKNVQNYILWNPAVTPGVMFEVIFCLIALGMPAK